MPQKPRKQRPRWQPDGGNSWVKDLGPFRLTVVRDWDAGKPSVYRLYLTVKASEVEWVGVGERIEIPVERLDVDPSDVRADAVACMTLEKMIKNEIKSWIS